MTRENSLRIAVIVAVLTTTVGVAAISFGTSSVNAETSDEVYINETGTPTNIIPGDTSHTIHDIQIDQNNSDFRTDEVQLNINISSISTYGVNTSEAYVGNTTIQNGHLRSQGIYSYENSTESLYLVIEYTGNGDPIQIDKVVIDGLKTNNSEKKSSIKYSFKVTSSTGDLDNSSTNTDDSTFSKEFNIAGGSFQFRDQATGSSDGDRFTIPSATIEDVETNVNSTLIVAFEDGDTRIAGMKSVSRDTINQNNEITIRYLEANGFPGPHKIYLVPESKLSSENYSTGDKLPTAASKFSLATHTGDSLFASINFDNISTNAIIEDNITISSTQLDDEHGGMTPYIVTIHPILSDGSVLTQEYLGTSQIITGNNQDVEIELRNKDGDPVHFSQSNRYAAVMRLVDDGSEVGDSVSLGSFPLLQNSDYNQQFVQNGVSNTALISVNKSEKEISDTKRTFNKSSLNHSQQIYAGGIIAFEGSIDGENRVELHRESTQTESVLEGIESTTNNSTQVHFNTSQLSTGNYSLIGGGFDKQSSFKIIGRADQYSNLISISKSSVVGDLLEFELVTDSNSTKVTITESTTNDSIATATVTTPRGESTTLRFNTYAAGDPDLESDLFTLDGPGTIESVTTSTADGTIPAGEYAITATAEPGGSTDTATATLRDRSMNDLAVYSTTENGVDAFSTPETVTDAIANGTLTPAENVTDDETVVYAVNATGLSGYTAVCDPDLSTGADLDRLAGLEFTVSNESATGSDAAPAATANGTTVLSRETGLFLVGNATETLDETVGTSAETDLTATFDVIDERLRAAAGSNASHAGSEPFTYVQNATGSDGTSDSGETTDDSNETTDTGDPIDDTVDTGDSTGSSNDSATVENETTDVTDGSSHDGGSVNDGSTGDTTEDENESLETAEETTIDDESDGNLDGTVETTTETSSGDDALDSDGADGASGTDTEGADDGGSGGSSGSESNGGVGGSSSGSSGGSGGGGGAVGGDGAIGGDGDDAGSTSGENDGDADRSAENAGRDSDSVGDESSSDSDEESGSRPDLDEENEADASTDRGEGEIGSDGDAEGPGSASDSAANDVGESRAASSRASAARAAEERTIRDRREIGPRPVADTNAPEEAEYVSRSGVLEGGSTPSTAAAATGHDDTSSSGGSDAPGDSLGSSDDDRSARPPTFEEAPLRSTAYDVPGFGVITALLAIASASVLAGRRETP
ncbi:MULTISPECIES: hypothetical protein [Haloferacaceae]|uniref:Cell surface glycoprotein n=1 Tax=Halorubrum glutamatedens TaxID=2707018 RepID=A0ABD5QUT2_9EURY|nr:hypothetical protein [Halobellus captivus]